MRSAVTYPLRRLAWWFRSPDPACAYRWCAARQVGYSKWCRVHTDRILHGESTAAWPRQ